jgi:hypothetical protein
MNAQTEMTDAAIDGYAREFGLTGNRHLRQFARAIEARAHLTKPDAGGGDHIRDATKLIAEPSVVPMPERDLLPPQTVKKLWDIVGGDNIFEFSDSVIMEYIRRVSRQRMLGSISVSKFKLWDLIEKWRIESSKPDSLSHIAACVAVEDHMYKYADARVSEATRELVDGLRKAITQAEIRICTHDETHRGGAIWEICDQCGAKWADDEGGKPEFKWPEAIVELNALIAKYTQTQKESK